MIIHLQLCHGGGNRIEKTGIPFGKFQVHTLSRPTR